jgi:hypothetical protein
MYITLVSLYWLLPWFRWYLMRPSSGWVFREEAADGGNEVLLDDGAFFYQSTHPISEQFSHTAVTTTNFYFLSQVHPPYASRQNHKMHMSVCIRTRYIQFFVHWLPMLAQILQSRKLFINACLGDLQGKGAGYISFVVWTVNNCHVTAFCFQLVPGMCMTSTVMPTACENCGIWPSCPVRTLEHVNPLAPNDL